MAPARGGRAPLLGQAMIIGDIACMRKHMAKSDSFYIRAQTDAAAGGAYAQTEIDLGSFVNLGVKTSTLLRIHNIAVQYADGTIAGGISPELPMHTTVAGGGKVAFQLTTQSQSSMVSAVDKSLVASGNIQFYGDPAGASGDNAHGISATHDLDVGPQMWRNGYLVGVDTMFLGAEAGGTITSGDSVVSIVLECTLESATQASATALALSQQ